MAPARIKQAELDRRLGEEGRRLDLLAFSIKLQAQWHAALRKAKEDNDGRAVIMILHELGLWLERHARLVGQDLAGALTAQVPNLGALSDDELRAVIGGMRVKIIDGRPD